ncbi:MAG: protoporphyrinogen oxidase HemJ [Pseudomonadota bacterium]
MTGFLGEAYLWVKALHIIAVISWMAGMLYLPRLYVYHSEAEAHSPLSETFKVMERRLLRLIINPAMIVAWLAGLAMAADLGAWLEPWLHAKLLLLVGMQVIHAAFARWRRQFAVDQNRYSGRFFRIMNEVPTLLMIGIVVIVIVKPF